MEFFSNPRPGGGNLILSGRNHSVTVATVQKLCDGLGITIEEFFHSPLFREPEQEIR